MPLAALLSGALLAGASVPAPAGALAFVALAPLLHALAGAPPLRRAFRDGWLAGLVYFGVGFGWVFQSEVGGLAPPLVYASVLPLLAAGTGLFAAAVAWLARRSAGLALAAAPGLWVAFEYGRSQDWPFAVPWLHLGYAVADHAALIQGASVFGLYGLSAWLVAVNAGLVWMARIPRAQRIALAVALAAPLLPALPLLVEPGPPAQQLRVGAVQPALAARERHAPERLQPNLRRLLDLTEPVAAARADVVVWPESAWERALGPAGDAFLAAIAHDLETPVLTGVWRAPSAGLPGWRNAAVLATRDGRTPVVAEKVHPVPLYERAPDGLIGRALARLGLWAGRFERGAPGEPLVLPGPAPVRVGVLICADASHPELARAARRAGAQVLVTIANEAGSGAWSAALHARAARLRAVENRVPVVRVANTGPTLWIDAYGRVLAALAPGQAASAVHAVALAGPPPARPRDAAVAGGCFVSALAIGAAHFRKPVRGVE
jgi:apolipoprotein N-acyltransferase